MIGDFIQSEFVVMIEQVEDAHLVSRHLKVVLVSRGKLRVNYSCTHGEVPIQFSVVVSWLIFVEVCKVFHAGVYLYRHRQVEEFVCRPVSFCENLDVKFKRAIGSFSNSVLAIPLRLLLAEFKIIHHTFDTICDSSTAINFKSRDYTSLVIDAL